MSTIVYESSLAHIMEELERIEALVSFHLHCVAILQKTDEQRQDLMLTDKQVSSLLEQPFGMPLWAVLKSDHEYNETLIKLNEWRQAIDKNIVASLSQGIELRLVKLQKTFNLSLVEIDILLLCLAAELDPRFQQLYGYLQDNVTKKRPSIHLILNLLSNNLIDKCTLKIYFDRNANLFQLSLLERAKADEASDGSTLDQSLKISERVFNYLLGQDHLDFSLAHIADITTCSRLLDKLLLPKQIKEFWQQTILIWQKQSVSPAVLVHLQGEEGSGRQSLAEAICQAMDKKLLVIDTALLLALKSTEFNAMLATIKREALLQQAALYWRDFHLVLEKEYHFHYATLLKQLADYSGILFLAGNKEWQPPHALINNYQFISQILSPLTSKDRQDLWQQALPEAASNDLTEIANIFKLTPRQIFSAASSLKHLSNYFSEFKLTKENLYEACRNQALQRLSTLAKAVKPTYQRHDIILSPDCQAQLDEIINYVKHQTVVYEQWGFAEKLALGKGLNVLFSGPPGTGKTMAAEIIAAALNLTLYKIDLANMVSKFIGETEKNLSRIFAEAEASNVILFFDEADAIFGKRSETQDAHDRYANIETSYLLQKIEEHPGIIILATNFKRNLDDAFIRRLHFSLDFRMPTPEERLQIWQTIWPDNIRLSDDVNLQKLADNLEIAGGNIRNIALTAAFKAAEQNSNLEFGIVTIHHLMIACERELKKMGRMVVQEQFRKLFN